MRRAPRIELSEPDRSTLTRWSRGRSTEARLVLRAQIVLRAAEGHENRDIAKELGVSRPTVGVWRQRFADQGLAGIQKDAPRTGRPSAKRESVEKSVIEATTQTRPADATQWSTRTLARELGVSASMVQRIWKANGLQPHRVRGFKLSNDKRFVEKLVDVVGLYLNPPEHALVLCADEKSQIQALDRTQPGLPLKKGRCGTMTHDYKRHGTTTLFVAIEMAEGKVIASCMPRHRHQEWIKFLKQIDTQTPPDLELHLILDNYSTHKHPKVQAWRERHPRFHFHFIPTSSSWLNLVERFFNELTRKQIRHGTFTSVAQLHAAILRYIELHNADPKPFIWTACAQSILDKVGRGRLALDKSMSA
ncbi:MAG TPA: IS630 family transposase [Thermoanaerobaculia bacterium]|nr:IS630 family transposase [Thermoanaerobaculia bacterium]